MDLFIVLKYEVLQVSPGMCLFNKKSEGPQSFSWMVADFNQVLMLCLLSKPTLFFWLLLEKRWVRSY